MEANRWNAKYPGARLFRIDQAIVWETVEKHIPPLKAELQDILGQLPVE